MVRIRLSRHGAKKHPFYRIVVASSASPRDGRYIDQVGTYDPSKPEIKFQVEKLKQWRAKGAQPSETVGQLIRKAGVDGPPA
jgi:small subunit ribosomal protein S16